MPSRRLLFFVSALLLCATARAATVLVVQFHNASSYPDLNWVGESVAEKLSSEMSNANQIVLDRDTRAEGLRHLSLRPQAAYTKATIIRLGQSLDADYVCYGTYDIHLSAGVSELKDSSIQLTARFIDLKKLHDGPEFSEAGKLSELSTLEEHLAWESIKYLDPSFAVPLNQFLSPRKVVRVDAEESYIRGLLSPNKAQQEKWFSQAFALDPQLTNAALELGKLALAKQEYRPGMTWFQKVPETDSHYEEARFQMGLCAYGEGDYTEATNYFREVLKLYPLSEIYNNLATAENRLNLPIAIEDFRRAADSDPNDPVYQFNLGLALLKNGAYEEAEKRFQAVLDHDSGDTEAQTLLDECKQRQPFDPKAKGSAQERLKMNFNSTAFRQLKAMLQPKTGG